MLIDLDRHLFTNSDFLLGMEDVPLGERTLLEGALALALGVLPTVTRLTSHLQGPLEFLQARAEIRLHAWFDLPAGHPRFPTADRGLVALVQGADERGLTGRAVAIVSWLGAPLPDDHGGPTSPDWVVRMEAEQGYRDLPDSEWSKGVEGYSARQLFSWVLARHLATSAPRASLVLAGRLAQRHAPFEE